MEIEIPAQRLRAYDSGGRLVGAALVSPGKAEVDEKGRPRSETSPGFFRVAEVSPIRRWSKDPRVKMLNWIGLVPGVEKGIHTLSPIGEFANFEQLLG